MLDLKTESELCIYSQHLTYSRSCGRGWPRFVLLCFREKGNEMIASKSEYSFILHSFPPSTGIIGRGICYVELFH